MQYKYVCFTQHTLVRTCVCCRQKNNFADSSVVRVKILRFHPFIDGVSLQQHLLFVGVSHNGVSSSRVYHTVAYHDRNLIGKINFRNM